MNLSFSVSFFLPSVSSSSSLCLSLAATPGNDARRVPSSKLTRNSSCVPYKIMLRMSSGRFLIWVLREKPYFLAMASRIRKVSESLYFPIGNIPPAFMDFDVSGIILSISILVMNPRPLHLGQAPCGELKEKVKGAGSGRESPVSASIRCMEKNLRFSFSSPCLIIAMVPLPLSSAVFIEAKILL